MADHSAKAPAFDLAGTSILKIEQKDYDEYIGTADDLIAVGLIKRDQFPPEGKWGVSYLGGERVPGRCRIDETFLRVGRRNVVDAPWFVRIGLPSAELAKRRAEANAENRIKTAERKARWAAESAAKDLKDRTEQAERAKRCLKQMPDSEREFLRESVASVRELSFEILLKRLDEEKSWHGYRFSSETKEAALMAVDAIVEALVQGDVIFDAERHAQIVAEHQAVIRAADPLFEEHLKALTRPNAAILEGEAQ
jgi:hypothetical protein